jgi:hypothetical protein
MPPTAPYACLTSCTRRKPSAVVKSGSPTSRSRPRRRFEPFGPPARLMVGNREAYHARTKALLARPRSRGPRGAGDRNWPYRAARVEHLTPFATVAEAKIWGTQFVREASVTSLSQQSCSLLCPYALVERRPPRGAPASTPASMPAVTIHSSNAWLRFRETAGFARQTNSRLRIGPVRTRAGAINAPIRRCCFSPVEIATNKSGHYPRSLSDAGWAATVWHHDPDCPCDFRGGHGYGGGRVPVASS